MKGIKLTAGLLTAAMMIGSFPVEALASKSAESDTYITGTSVSFSAGATAAINATVVLNDTKGYFAEVTEHDAPVVAEAAEAVEDYSNMAVAANVDEFLNIRTEPSLESSVAGKLYVNGVATVLETLDGWYKIESGNVTGYARTQYLVVGDAEACKAVAKRTGTVGTDTLRLRKEASTEAEVYTLLSKDQKVTVLDESNTEWVKVKYKSYEGYLSTEFVTVNTEYEYAESREEEKARLEKEAAANRKKQQANQQANQPAAPEKVYNAPTTGNGAGVVEYALQFVGNPYVYGGTSLTNGADCSGFVMSVYAAFGISLPHSSSAMRNVGWSVDPADVQPGDIICYSGHVAIYIGNGAIVHASTKKTGIKVSNNWQYKTVLAVRRVI